MDTIYGFAIIIGMLAGEMGHDNYSVREWATVKMSALVNEHDAALPLILPLLNSDNPEVVLRAGYVIKQYWNVHPSESGSKFPKITAYNAMWDDDWMECFGKGFYLYTNCRWDDIEQRMVAESHWETYGDAAQINACQHWIQRIWKRDNLTRKQVIAILDQMVENQRTGKRFIPDIPDQNYDCGDCGPCGMPAKLNWRGRFKP